MRLAYRFLMAMPVICAAVGVAAAPVHGLTGGDGFVIAAMVWLVASVPATFVVAITDSD